MAELELIKLAAVFAVIVALLWLGRPLYLAILAGSVAVALLYAIPLDRCAALVLRVCRDPSALTILGSLYLITFLQRMLERRDQIRLAQQDLNGLFHDRRVNATVAPLFIGLLPSAAAMLLCGDIVKQATDGYLDREEQAVVTTWFRHIPESSLPTYAGVLLMSDLAGVPLPLFMAGMVVPVICLALLGYLRFLRRLPADPGTPRSGDRWGDALGLLRHLWSLVAILVLILALDWSVVASVGAVILAAALVYRFPWEELRPLFRQSVEKKMLGNTFLVLVLREFLAATGSLERLPPFFAQFPIPMYLVFALLFFFGSLISGTTGIIALGTPLAFAAIDGAGMPLMVLLMCMCHATSQISPVHVCLAVATEYFGISLGQLVRKTLPLVLVFCVLMLGYYNLLLLL